MKTPPKSHVEIRPFGQYNLLAEVSHIMDGTIRYFISGDLSDLKRDQVDTDEEDNIHMMCPRWAEIDLQELEKLV